MSENPLDIVVGTTDTSQRDKEAAKRHRDAVTRADESGDTVAAISELRKAISADPFDDEIRFDLAVRLDRVGEEDEAISLYESILEHGPAPINTLINLAVLYEDQGNFHRAERLLKQVLETNPNDPRARMYMKDVQASKDMLVEEESDRDLAKRRALYDIPVTDFELSVRARTCLKKMNIRTLGDLVRTSESELMSYKNFGESSLIEISRMLASKNLKLGQGADDAHRQHRRNIADALRGSGKDGVLNKTVSELQLSVRARKALQLLDIQTIGDLVSRTEAELMGVKNFGSTSLVEVKERLTLMGLSLRQLDE